MNDKFEYRQISEAYSQIKEDMKGPFDGGKYIVCIYRTNQATVHGQFIGVVIEIPSGQKVAQVAISPDDTAIAQAVKALRPPGS